MFVGTIPIGVDVPGSDIDIICEAADLEAFGRVVEEHHGRALGFQRRLTWAQRLPSCVCRFQHGRFELELFAQPLPVRHQAAYKHMMAEWRLLQAYGPRLRRAVRTRKRRGVKTEPAFAQALRMSGDAYIELLAVADMTEPQLKAFVAAHPLRTRARRS